jgi:hypothetical protein
VFDNTVGTDLVSRCVHNKANSYQDELWLKTGIVYH